MARVPPRVTRSTTRAGRHVAGPSLPTAPAPAPPRRAPSPSAQSRAALWELWSSRLRGARRRHRRGIGLAPAWAPATWAGQRRGGGSATRAGGVRASAPSGGGVAGAPAAIPADRALGAGKLRLRGMRGGRAARPGQPRDWTGPAAAGPRSPRLLRMLWGAGARLHPSSRPGGGPRPPDSLYVLSAAASAVFAVRAGHHPPPPLCPIAVPSIVLTPPPTFSTLFPVTLHLGPFPCCLSRFPQP